MQIEVVAALIAAVVSLGIWILSILFDPIKERITHGFKLKIEHEYQQQKNIKACISKYKTQLLDSAEALNHRIWNMHYMHPSYTSLELEESYYMNSLVFKFLAFFSWVKKTEEGLIYLDSSIADKQDLIYVKYMRLFQRIFCEAKFMIDVDDDYDTSCENDHFFIDNFKSISSTLFTSEPDKILDFEAFWTEIESLSGAKRIRKYFCGISPIEKRYRWDIMQLFHYTLILFLNRFGYDFQRTSVEKIQKLLLSEATKKTLLIKGYFELLDQYGMLNLKEVKQLKELIQV